MIILPKISSEKETEAITRFITSTLKKEGFEKVVIGISGGIDSSLSLSLLAKAIKPENIFPVHLYYFESKINDLKELLKQTKIPEKNIYNISIKKQVDSFAPTSEVTSRPRQTSEVNRTRLGNIMARIRMIMLYDFSKKHNALVCGTENRSEALLGYFTRFGDEASDIEPIQHLYKTQVFDLAYYLKVPQNIINSTPSAGLWNNQTDEKEFGFSYKDADIVLHLYFDKKQSIKEITKNGFKNADKIIKRAKDNSFKHHLPYKMQAKNANL